MIFYPQRIRLGFSSHFSPEILSPGDSSFKMLSPFYQINRKNIPEKVV